MPHPLPALDDDDTAFDLQTFFPYLVRVFSVDVSEKVSSTYADQFDMSPAEWRTMATLRPDRALSATQIVEFSSMDKVVVSRAVSKMSDRGWVKVEKNAQDKRSKLLRLTRAGATVYHKIVPRVQEAEEAILAGLNSEQIEILTDLMAQIRRNCQP